MLRSSRAAAGTTGGVGRAAALLTGGGRPGGALLVRAAAVVSQRIAAVIVSALAAITGVSSGTIIIVAIAVIAVIAVALAFLPLMNQTTQQASTGTLTGALAATGTDVPPDLVPLYNAAGTLCTQIPATLLAAQGKQESGFNPRATSPVGAEGIAQFMPGTWATWGADANGDGRADPFDPADAIPAQARYMCDLAARIEPLVASGKVQGDVQLLTLAAYNAGLGNVTSYGGVPPFAETQAYGPRILALAQTYGATLTAPAAGLPGGVAGAGDYAAVIDALTQRVGTPYAWGGGGINGPSKGFGRGAGTVGWDCSSFMQYGFYQATGGALTLPRTAAAQATAYRGNAVSADQLQPGDLLFYGGIASANHVAMYLGAGKMIEEPRTGLAARITTARMDFSLAARVPLP